MDRARTRVTEVAAAGLVIAVLAGCGGGSGSGGTTGTSAPVTSAASASAATAADVSGIDPCSLLTDAEVATIAPGVGHGKVDQVAGAKICDWPDAHGVPAVQLQVTPAPPSLESELKNGIGAFGGYTIVPVTGLGDGAAAAFQKADPSKGLTAGMATLIARSGGRAVGLSTPMTTITQGSARFTAAKALVAKAISRL